jgi:hypothetical protein
VPTTTLNYDSNNTVTGSVTPVQGGEVKAEASYGGRDSAGNSVAGGDFLPHRSRSAQDTASPDPGDPNEEERATGYSYDSNGNLQTIKRVPAIGVETNFDYRPTSDSVDGKTGQL